eukprot:CAMPEP_0171086802 /NCGR_PEP_ID=MMETSP0766_2-20121228/19770_1 /TAXON_ID=439317 /ORGANISM="Gambierdiscus australes, Strain CAWD 149" /LENGTH=123 /DNA_ID=CAMNT_0011544471 /DNA_START=244 /DNA_END=615 /DNA_ORIENTATION=-
MGRMFGLSSPPSAVSDLAGLSNLSERRSGTCSRPRPSTGTRSTSGFEGSGSGSSNVSGASGACGAVSMAAGVASCALSKDTSSVNQPGAASSPEASSVVEDAPVLDFPSSPRSCATSLIKVNT